MQRLDCRTGVKVFSGNHRPVLLKCLEEISKCITVSQDSGFVKPRLFFPWGESFNRDNGMIVDYRRHIRLTTLIPTSPNTEEHPLFLKSTIDILCFCRFCLSQINLKSYSLADPPFFA